GAGGPADSTPWPGTPGTSVFLAHDVSYFALIANLQPGDVINYEANCVTHVFHVIGHVIVKAGAPIPQLSGNGLVLDTCWPTHALWYTPDRYLVESVEVSVKSSRTAANNKLQTWPTGYTTTAPAALVAQGLTLEQNEEPMGSLALTGTSDNAWAQSPAPLAVEAAGLEALFGGLHAAAQKRTDFWNALAPGVTIPAPIWGAWVSGHDAPLDVTITATGATPTAITLSTVYTLTGGSAPGKYRETVTEAIHGLTVTVTNWEVSHG
ncbi:MAG: sortase family protein, partial [Acidimicrobiales bacterium]